MICLFFCFACFFSKKKYFLLIVWILFDFVLHFSDVFDLFVFFNFVFYFFECFVHFFRCFWNKLNCVCFFCGICSVFLFFVSFFWEGGMRFGMRGLFFSRCFLIFFELLRIFQKFSDFFCKDSNF